MKDTVALKSTIIPEGPRCLVNSAKSIPQESIRGPILFLYSRIAKKMND